MAPAKPFRVEALLPAPASTYFLERDSAAFRSLLSKAGRRTCPLVCSRMTDCCPGHALGYHMLLMAWSLFTQELDTFADVPTLLHVNVQVLKIGQLEFNDLWHEGASSFVRMVTKPEFGSWVSYMTLVFHG